MENRTGTLVKSISEHVKKRLILGVCPNTSFLLYDTISDYIDYCNSKEELVYRNYAKVLREKLALMKLKCDLIKPSKYEVIEYHQDNISVASMPLKLSLKDYSPKHKYKPTEFLLESTDFTINNKLNLTTTDTEVFLENRFLYFTISDTEVIRVSKLVHDNLTALGYSLLSNENNTLIYFNEKGSKLSINGEILNPNDSFLHLFVTAFSYHKGVLYKSNRYCIEVPIPTENVIEDSGNIEMKVEVDTYSQDKEATHTIKRMSYNKATFSLPNLYAITFISRFLKYDLDSNLVSLSTEYKYEWFGEELVAIPNLVYELLEQDYYIGDTTPNIVTMSKLLDNGNLETIEVNTFPIKNSLLIKYRTLVDGLPSVEKSIQFVIDAPKEEVEEIKEKLEVL